MTNTALNMPIEQAEAVGDELPSGTQLCHGQYTIVNYLNSGGFGITYLALDSLGRKIVIKECFPGAMCRRNGETVRLRSRSYELDFERVVDLFEKEARALAQLQHHNIVGVHQIFKDNGTAYMALDFVEGPDLLQVMESTPDKLDPAGICRILVRLLDALAYVHSNGILHRDISPDNILLCDDGTPVLIDFGAARENATRASRVLSQVHTVKDGYSPQEFYLAGSPQEKSSDLYALAATMHHLMTGEAPPNSNMRLAAVAEKSPDPYVPMFGRVKGYDEHFLKAIDDCLAVFAKDRLESAQDWYDAIDQTRRRQMMVEKAREDQEIESRISMFVAETTQAVEDIPAPKPPRQAERAATPEPVKPDPKEAEREYWAILNDYSDDEDESPHVDASVPGQKKPKRKRRFLWGLFSRSRRDQGANEPQLTRPYRG